MDSSTPGQNTVPTEGTSIPIANSLGGITPPSSSMSSPTPSTPMAPMSPLPPQLPSEPELSIKPSGSGFKKVIPWIVAVVLALAVGGGVWWWQNQQLASAKADLASQKDTLEKRVTTLQTQLDEAKASTTEEEPTATVTSSDKDLITAVVKADCEAEVKLKFFEVKDVHVEGKFATVTNGCDLKTRSTSRHNYMTLKKVGETWVIVYEGTSVKPSSSTMTKFGIPASLYD